MSAGKNMCLNKSASNNSIDSLDELLKHVNITNSHGSLIYDKHSKRKGPVKNEVHSIKLGESVESLDKALKDINICTSTGSLPNDCSFTENAGLLFQVCNQENNSNNFHTYGHLYENGETLCHLDVTCLPDAKQGVQGDRDGPPLDTSVPSVEDIIVINESRHTGKSTLWGAVLLILCQMAGGGDLGLAYAVKEGKLIAIASLLVYPFIFFFTAVCLSKCLYVKDIDTGVYIRRYSTFADLGKAFWPRHGRKVVLALQIVVMLLLCSMYLVLCGSFLSNTFSDLPIHKNLWTVIGTVAILPLVFFKSLSKLTWVSFFGVIAILIPVIVTLWYCITKNNEWNMQALAVLDASRIPVALNIISMSYGIHACLLRIEQDLAVKTHFKWAVMASYVLAVMFKLSLGILGFLTFTSHSKQLITNNIPKGLLTIIVSCSLGIKVLCSYPFLLFVAVRATEDLIPERCKNGSTLQYISIRLFLVALTLSAALSIPQFGILLSFIGSISSSLFCMILPTLFDLKLRFKDSRNWEKVLDVGILLLGCASCISGVVYASKSLAR